MSVPICQPVGKCVRVKREKKSETKESLKRTNRLLKYSKSERDKRKIKKMRIKNGKSKGRGREGVARKMAGQVDSCGHGYIKNWTPCSKQAALRTA